MLTANPENPAAVVLQKAPPLQRWKGLRSDIRCAWEYADGALDKPDAVLLADRPFVWQKPENRPADF